MIYTASESEPLFRGLEVVRASTNRMIIGYASTLDAANVQKVSRSIRAIKVSFPDHKGVVATANILVYRAFESRRDVHLLSLTMFARQPMTWAGLGEDIRYAPGSDVVVEVVANNRARLQVPEIKVGVATVLTEAA